MFVADLKVNFLLNVKFQRTDKTNAIKCDNHSTKCATSNNNANEPNWITPAEIENKVNLIISNITAFLELLLFF